MYVCKSFRVDAFGCNIKTIGTSACPSYHLAIVIGGSSAETNLKSVKLASAKYLDNLPEKGMYVCIDVCMYVCYSFCVDAFGCCMYL